MDDVNDLLQDTSRTFALAVPLLPPVTRQSVALAYLLFRCADTLEDAATWSLDRRRSALRSLARMLEDGEACDVVEVSGWLRASVTKHEGYARLLQSLPELLGEIDRLPRATSSILRRHARRTALGMADLLEACTSGLASIEALRGYCYVVAGIVGELLTDLFVQDAPRLAAVKADLVAEQNAFGEALQLVNILKDERDDRHEGRLFVPVGVSRGDILALAAEDLRAARRYIAALERASAPSGFVAFTSFPCELAERTLDALRRQGPGAKVSRVDVAAMFARHLGMAARSI